MELMGPPMKGCFRIRRMGWDVEDFGVWSIDGKMVADSWIVL
jgi:hypothetical protein